MARNARSVVAVLVTVGLMAGPTPALAGSSQEHGAAADVLELVEDLGASAQDVTDDDGSLRGTADEVVVMTTGADGSPEVTKLRAGSALGAEQLAEQLDRHPDVIAAPNSRLSAFGLLDTEPLAGRQWNLGLVAAPVAWATSQGAGVVVAVVDTRIDASHPDLADRMLRGIDLLPQATAAGSDTNGHGTAVASIIAAGLNGWGMAGVAPRARILPITALDPAGFGDTATVARGIIAAADAGARVINLSLGGPDRDPVLEKAVAYAWSKGVVLVAAVGNSRHLGNPVQYPAATGNVLGVGSVDRTGAASYFSNTGAHVDLVAPGEEVIAAMPDGGFDPVSGTSFAAPHVSAALALVAAANPGLTAAELVRVVELAAQDDPSGNGRDPQFGRGIVRPDRAVVAARTAGAPAAAPVAPRLRLVSLDARPEPLKRGRVATVRVKVQARRADGAWRIDRRPTLVRFEYRAIGSRTFRAVAKSTTIDGWATVRVRPWSSGSWRAYIRQVDGTWSRSGADYLPVRR